MGFGEDFSNWAWGFVKGKPIKGNFSDYRDGPTKTETSETFAKALKARGHKFVGPTIVYAWMQAVGMYNDHELGCPRRVEVEALAR